MSIVFGQILLKLLLLFVIYRKVPKFSDARNFAVIYLKIKPKAQTLGYLVNGIANSEDPDQTAPLGAV